MFKKILHVSMIITSLSVPIYSMAAQAPLTNEQIKQLNTTNYKSAALRLNAAYINKLNTPNEVFNDIYKSYLKDVEARYSKMMDAIKTYDENQDRTLKPLNDKIDGIRKSFNEDSDAYVEDLVKKEREQNAFDIKKVTKNKFTNQQKLVNETFPNEEKVFIEIFRAKMKEYTITDAEKAFLDKSIKETVTILKNNPLTLDKSVFDTQLANVEKSVNVYQSTDNLYKGLMDQNFQKLDKALFDNIWKYSRSNSVYK